MAAEIPNDAATAKQRLNRTLPSESFAAEVAPAPAVTARPGGIDENARLPLDRPGIGSLLVDRGHPWPEDSRERYDVERMIGMGATGQVFAVIDRDLDRPLALKLLSADRPDAETLRNFIDEARITASLEHPNVLPVHELGVDAAGHVFFSMKRVVGSSLGALIERSAQDGARMGKLASFNDIVAIMIDVCHALAFAHHKGIVHQDIKPDNIMLGDFGEVLLVDWGSATRVDRGDRRLYGTPLYMSPEQARRSHADRASDLYCLGATLFHALTLRLPTWSDDPEEFWNKKRAGIIDPLSVGERQALPAPLLAIALKALAADPAARYDSAESLVADLRHYQAGLAVAAYRESLWALALRWYGFNRRAFWVGAISAVAVAALSLAWWHEKLKESTAWRLVGEEDFSAETLADVAKRWKLMIPDGSTNYKEEEVTSPYYVTMEKRQLALAAGKAAVDLAWRVPMLGNVRIDWEYTPVLGNLNLNCFIGSDCRKGGHTFHVGGYSNPAYVVLTKGPRLDMVDDRDLGVPLRVGTRYHFRMEREGSHTRLEIDGRRLFDDDDLEDANERIPYSFGFDTYSWNRVLIDHVRIYRQALPQKLPLLAVADELFRLEHYAEARQRYQDITAYYPETDMAATAQFRIGVCTLRLGAAEAGLRLLAEFADAHPAHDLAPLARYELWSAARAKHDQGAIDRALDGLARYRGNAILRRVLFDMSDDALPMLEPREITGIADSAYPADIIVRIEKEHEALAHWSDIFGISTYSNAFMYRSGAILSRLGALDYVAGHYPADSVERAEALYLMGRYQEVLSSFGHLDYLVPLALLALDRTDQVIARKSGEIDLAHAYLQRGDVPRVLGQFAHTWVADGVLRRLGRFDELLRLHEKAQDAVYLGALVDLGRADEVLRDHFGEDSHVTARALIQQRRYDEAIAAFPTDTEAMYLIGLRCFIDGDHARALDLMARLARRELDMHETGEAFTRHLLPWILRVLDGRAEDGEQALRLILHDARWFYGQTLWHSAAFIAGESDESALLAQPDRRYVRSRACLARALRAERNAAWADALDAYAAWLATPPGDRPENDLEEEFVKWRYGELKKGR